MTTTPAASIADAMAEVIATLEGNRDALEALADVRGSILFNPESKLGLAFEDDQPNQPRVTFIGNARIFTNTERGIGKGPRFMAPHLRSTYNDGGNRPFQLFDIQTARRLCLDDLNQCLASLMNQVANKPA